MQSQLVRNICRVHRVGQILQSQKLMSESRQEEDLLQQMVENQNLQDYSWRFSWNRKYGFICTKSCSTKIHAVPKTFKLCLAMNQVLRVKKLPTVESAVYMDIPRHTEHLHRQINTFILRYILLCSFCTNRVLRVGRMAGIFSQKTRSSDSR
jgi:hypothetical protein